MAEQYDFDLEVVPTDRLDLLRERLRARGKQGWHLVAVLPYARGDVLFLAKTGLLLAGTAHAGVHFDL